MTANYEFSGIIDMHVHSAPDVRRRSHDDITLAQQAERLGARAVVIKSHLVPTMDRAYLINKMFPGVSMFGSITLNASVGGINPHAVRAALQLGAKIVWLPTIDAVNHREHEGKAGGVEVIRDGSIVPSLSEVLKLITEHDAILATGHLSPKEIFMVVEAAKEHGAQKIVVTHPEFHSIRLSISEQRDLVKNYGVYLERTYAQPLGDGKYKLNLPDNLRAIESVGYESTIVSTDGGQIENPLWQTALTQYVEYLLENGVSADALDTMTKKTPAKLLNME